MIFYVGAGVLTGSLVFHPINNTPTITKRVPVICARVIGSRKIKCACRIVDTGPTLEMIAALLEPIFLIPFDIKKVGITVARIASANPYHNRLASM